MVGGSSGCVSSRARHRFPEELSLGLQMVDGAGARFGLDQYENNSRRDLLSCRDAHRALEKMVGKRSDGATVATRSGQLPNPS